MRRAAGVAIALFGAGLAVACGRSPAPAVQSAPRRLAAAAGLPVPAFRPPADGLLSEGQIDLYLRVRRAAKGRTDAEAARAVGVSAEEFAWVRARILEALVALDGRRVREASQEVYAKTIASLREARKSARDPNQARTLEEQIAAVDRERASLRREETLAPSIARNTRLVAARRAEVEAVSP